MPDTCFDTWHGLLCNVVDIPKCCTWRIVLQHDNSLTYHTRTMIHRCDLTLWHQSMTSLFLNDCLVTVDLFWYSIMTHDISMDYGTLYNVICDTPWCECNNTWRFAFCFDFGIIDVLIQYFVWLFDTSKLLHHMIHWLVLIHGSCYIPTSSASMSYLAP